MKKVILLGSLVLLIGVGYYYFKDSEIYKNNKKPKDDILEKVENEIVNITKWTIYGNSLNIEGNLELLDNINLIKDIKLVLYGEQKIKYDINYNINNTNLSFNISDNINKGINLDKIEIDKYIVLMEITYKNEENDIKYYSLNNTTTYKDAEYYTITKNNKNNLINIYFKKKNGINYMKIDVKETTLPDNVYDFSIDPGHGGNDSGAYVNKISESEVVLEYGLLLKKKLNDLGYKVFITRKDNKDQNMGVFESYNKNGRVNIIQKSKSKLNLSIHLNSAPTKLKKGGVEIYIPNNIDTSFAKSIVDNIVESAKTTYSPNLTFKVDNGIYYKYFTPELIEQSKKDSEKYKYQLYNINDNTPFMYIVRELGGINTNAYMDGRNPRYGKNLYYDSNIGIESYLLELGFMVNDNDFNNIINNKEGYIEGIIESIIKKLENL